jgi:hypothetical protein
MFREAKEMEVMTARKDQVIKILGLKNAEGKSYFDLDFIVDRWLGMTNQDRMDNQKFKKKTEEKKKEEKEGEEKEGEGSSEDAFKL